MKLSEFVKKCGNIDLDMRIEVEGAGLGGTPTIDIKSVFAGFDWDYGKLILAPEKPLTVLPCKPKTEVFFVYNHQVEKGIVEGFSGKEDEVIIWCKRQSAHIWSSYKYCHKTYEEAEKTIV